MKKKQYKLWGWDKKNRTMFRFIKPGDIFCFAIDENRYGFGQIIFVNQWGHIVNIFDFISDTPEFFLEKKHPLLKPLLIDSYSLFDRKSGGEFRIIGHKLNYIIPDKNTIVFRAVTGKLVNLVGEEISDISKSDLDNFVIYAPLTGKFIVNRVLDALEKIDNTIK